MKGYALVVEIGNCKQKEATCLLNQIDTLVFLSITISFCLVKVDDIFIYRFNGMGRLVRMLSVKNQYLNL